MQPDLSLTTVLGRVIRSADRGIAMRLHGDALEKYQKRKLSYEEYLEFNDSFFALWHDEPRGTDPKLIAEKAVEVTEAKRKGEPVEEDQQDAE